MTTRRVVGCMTGTSIDGLDAALVEVRGVGLGISARALRHLSVPLGELSPALRRLAGQISMAAGEIARLSHDLSLLHIAAIQKLLCGEPVDLISVHGQTIFHAPPLSWQLLSASIIAVRTGTPVVFDLRAADLASGGQGAPITPLADWILLRDTAESRAVVNLGGFCNYTLLPAGCEPAGIRGGDLCACNQLLDALARRLLGAAFDRDGQAALRGTINARACSRLVERLRIQATARRSLGTDDEVAASFVSDAAGLSADDVLRTACEAVGRVIAEQLPSVNRVVLAGGGVKNAALRAAITAHSRATIVTSDELGLPITHREAVEMAVLGALCQDRIPITLPAVTGVANPAPVAGCWVYP